MSTAILMKTLVFMKEAEFQKLVYADLMNFFSHFAEEDLKILDEQLRKDPCPINVKQIFNQINFPELGSADQKLEKKDTAIEVLTRQFWRMNVNRTDLGFSKMFTFGELESSGQILLSGKENNLSLTMPYVFFMKDFACHFQNQLQLCKIVNNGFNFCEGFEDFTMGFLALREFLMSEFLNLKNEDRIKNLGEIFQGGLMLPQTGEIKCNLETPILCVAGNKFPANNEIYVATIDDDGILLKQQFGKKKAQDKGVIFKNAAGAEFANVVEIRKGSIDGVPTDLVLCVQCKKQELAISAEMIWTQHAKNCLACDIHQLGVCVTIIITTASLQKCYQNNIDVIKNEIDTQFKGDSNYNDYYIVISKDQCDEFFGDMFLHKAFIHDGSSVIFLNEMSQKSLEFFPEIGKAGASAIVERRRLKPFSKETLKIGENLLQHLESKYAFRF